MWCAATIAVLHTEDSEVTLKPQRVYELANIGAYGIYFSTGASAVAVNANQAADKFVLMAAVSGARSTQRIAGVSALKCKSITGGTVLCITFVGRL